MQIEGRRNDRKHILEMLIPFFGVLEPYKISILPVTAILLFAILLFRNNGKIYLTKSKNMVPYLLFVAYMVIRDLVHMAFSVSDPINVQINRLLQNTVLYVLIFFVCNDDFDEAVLFKWWKIAGVIFGAGMLYHVVQLLVLHQPIVPITIIPGYVLRSDSLDGSLRPTSFFAEPAAYVISMLPLLFLALKRKDLKWAFITTFLIAVSTSTLGVILAAVLWMLFVLFEKKSVLTTVLTVLFLGIFVVLFMNLEVFSDTLTKLEAVAEGESTFGSRVQAPFELVGLMDWMHLPFGNTLLDTREFVLTNPDLSYDLVVYRRALYRDSVYLNTIALLIFRYGIVGLWLFLRCFKNKLFNKNYGARMYAWMLLVASLGTQNVASPGIQMLLLFLYTYNVNSEERESQEYLVGNRLEI